MSPTRFRSAAFLLAASVCVCCFVNVPARGQTPPPVEAAKVALGKQVPALDFANTYAVIVGVLKWEDKRLAPFSPVNRKDQELYDTLRKRGVPAENMALLLDDKGTLANMRKSLQEVAAKAKPDSTLIVYYAGHGGLRPDGTTDFANYDSHGGNPQKPSFAVSEISDIVGKEFKGGRVLLLADCCHSGGLQEVVRSLAAAKIKATALTSADVLCTSTGSWIYTQTLIDCFAGDPLLDTDGDATITLGELAGEVARAMQYRERQRYGFAPDGIKPDFTLAPVNRDKKLPPPLEGPFTLKEYVIVSEQGKQRPGRIIDFRDKKYAVEFYDYTEKQVVQLPAASLSKIQYRMYKVGAKVVVAQPGFPTARVVEVSGDFHRVAFPNRRKGEEWLLSDQIVADPKSVAEVEWKGEWYPATVLKKMDDKHYIRYLGYDDSWNEWVGKDRIRFPVPARNPFEVVDVKDPAAEDVKAYAEKMKLPGDKDDKNAEQWVKKETEGKKESLEGEWSGRWEKGSGTATVKVIKDRIYILYTDDEGPLKKTTWLLEAVRENDRLIGRWVNVDNPKDTGPYAGRIVDDERIDGFQGGDRWDFRRKLKK